MMPADALVDARRAFRHGSKSFAAAALLFPRDTRRDSTLLYAWCRHCDDTIDGQVLGHDRLTPRSAPLDQLRALQDQTQRAFAGERLDHPAFIGLQQVVRCHAIPQSLASQHLDGYRMDVEGRHYVTIEDTLDYCYHVAGVVGLMMARVMGVRDAAVLRHACDLGIAFQLTNITRDLLDDARNGRVYVPQTWLAEAGIGPEEISTSPAARARIASRLIHLSQSYYASARVGIGALSFRSAWAIATARAVYQQIGTEILHRGEHAWQKRVHTTRIDKTTLIARGGLEALRRRRLSVLDARLGLLPSLPAWGQQPELGD